VSSPGNYPPTTMGGDPYHKVPLTGAPSFTAEPHEIPLQTSMPSVQLSLAANEQQPALRSPYGYVQPTTAPPQLSISTTATAMAPSDSSLSVPRYVDQNPRPSKSPRHASHQSVHSTGSVTNNDASAEYRYGSSYGAVNNNPSEMTPSSFNPESSTPQSAPPRDYYPPTNSWTSTAGEPSSTTAYTNSEGRQYTFPDQYKSGGSGTTAKAENPQPPPPAVFSGTPRGSFDTINHYSWNTS
jgi:hypothetical protein